MSKTPEQMAEEYANDLYKNSDYPEAILKHTKKATETAFLAGYQAAKEEYETKIGELEIELENWKHTAIHGDEGL